MKYPFRANFLRLTDYDYHHGLNPTNSVSGFQSYEVAKTGILVRTMLLCKLIYPIAPLVGSFVVSLSAFPSLAPSSFPRGLALTWLAGLTWIAGWPLTAGAALPVPLVPQYVACRCPLESQARRPLLWLVQPEGQVSFSLGGILWVSAQVLSTASARSGAALFTALAR